MKLSEEKSAPYVTSGPPDQQPSPIVDAVLCKLEMLGLFSVAGFFFPASERMDEEELQEADVLWPWPDTPPPSPEEEENYHQLYEYDAGDAVDFSCEPFSGPPVSSISSLTTSSAQWSESGGGLSSDGFFLSGPSSAGSAGLGLDGTEEFLEADVLWPDTDDEAEDGGGAAGFWRLCRHRVEEAASVAGAAAAACGEREGWRPLVSSPIDIPMAARGSSAAARRRRPSPLAAAVLARRRR